MPVNTTETGFAHQGCLHSVGQRVTIRTVVGAIVRFSAVRGCVGCVEVERHEHIRAVSVAVLATWAEVDFSVEIVIIE